MSETLLLGTYTRGNSQGIYTVDLDTKQKELNNLKLIAETGSPTYLTEFNGGDVIYSVYSKDDQGGIASFVKEEGRYILKDTVTEEGAAPCYVAYDEGRKLVYTANYHKGELQILKTDEDGSLSLVQSIEHAGSGPHENQTSAHAHYFDLTPDNKYVVSCDLGTDEVHTYNVDQDGTATEVNKLEVTGGFGPRHLVFHPDGTHAYLFGELSSEISVLEYNDGTFKVIDTVSTLPEDFTGESSGAAIRISTDGKFLYASNRGHDSIVTYQINDDYLIEAINWIKTEGKTPRDFNLTPDENFVIAGHQHEDKLTLFERDEQTGKLNLVQKDVTAPEVVCVEIIQ